MNIINNIEKRKNAFLLLIIIIEGFVSVAAEILVIRQLIPEVGSSVVVTSLIIGVFLLFLALGYWRGGVYQKDFYDILKRNFIIAASIFGVGLSYLFIAIFFQTFSLFLKIPAIIILVLYLLLIISPLVYLFGQTIPITMNLVKQEKLVGTIGGKVLFLSTVGSFFGAVLTTLLLMENLGVAWTVMINALLLLLLVFLMPLEKNKRIFTLGSILVISIFIYLANVTIEKSYFVATTNYANYHVASAIKLPNNSIGDIFQINESSSSFRGQNKEGFPYIEFIKKILFSDLKLHNENILVLGAGGFSLSAAGDFGNRITYVDIDPKIYGIAKQSFQPQINGKFIAADARVYLKPIKNYYQAIVSDVYSNVHTIPQSLLSREYFQEVRVALKENGVAIFNIIAHPFLDSRYAKRVDNTIRTVFGNCMVIPLEYVDNVTNIIYICRKAANESDNLIYTDNKNPSTLDSF